MVASRIGPGSAGISNAPRPERAKPVRPSEDTQAPARASHAKESFVTNQVASRQPPRLPLQDFVQSMAAQATTRLFSKDINALSARDADAISGDLASVYLQHAEFAKLDGHEDAVETLGELMRGYEHLRILRTGELG